MIERPRLEIFDSAEAAAVAATAAIVEHLQAALVERGAASLGVTGGSSPGPVYDRLKDAVLDWRHVAITLSDERWVDETSDQSNARLVRERLLVGDAAAARFLPLKGEETDLRHAAWSADLRIAGLVPFDILLLGMGEDGHVASLFPQAPLPEEAMDPAAARLVLPVEAASPAPPQDRLSLTIAAMASASLILILTRGAEKRRILETGDGLPVHSLISAARGGVRLIWSA
jgi:6-phosphogluconolactonase